MYNVREHVVIFDHNLFTKDLALILVEDFFYRRIRELLGSDSSIGHKFLPSLQQLIKFNISNIQ